MNHLVTNSEKRMFIEWFLHRYEFQKKESAWLLTYLMSDEKLLSNVHFVDDWIPSKRFMIMSTKCVADVPFQFRKGKLSSTDVERAFHDIRLHPDQEIHIKFSFRHAVSCPEYAAVREEIAMEYDQTISNTLYSLFAEMVLDNAILEYEKNKLYERIDRSLIEDDKETFLLLSRKWVEIQNNRLNHSE